ncbi:hypothetical protein ARMGADRAFT_1011918 [Armillaria gallica]|uniref:Uncharacterized protein n=1 Tax=Armillaria gallica TaxID=47427 RepID=A0A2H3DU91_ARMGA|nr:hypothetical protein ARMGADRAFT_1011918 [Armillaria gallica]
MADEIRVRSTLQRMKAVEVLSKNSSKIFRVQPRSFSSSLPLSLVFTTPHATRLLALP